ncbi:cytochrome c oxidase assembly protein [Hazenella sp. IB182357]|uniref:Cytochrome c oxidase assembly protein n=1 Tax=Polycladospora coralii TaxID=2771432 RepID=A0A926RTU0_9BACL|nr:cytochrome c oxidase assembly protein [Polycladospora coralii]MBD1371579.1 cytochrome c oxidase assembly protein [Polycladospora coralii]MBS7529047.1 cytochrome c oxidase assembly protein [Polycladospora coralii]
MTSAEFFQIFFYVSNWDLKLNVIMLCIAGLYLVLTGPMRHLFPNAEPAKGSARIKFLSGLLIYYIANGSPLNILGHELFSMHMLQMSLTFLLAPPLLLTGIPAYMYRALAKLPGVRKIGHFLTKPLVTIFFFNGFFTFYHVPYIFDASMNNEWLHIVTHYGLLFAAFCMWFPIFCPVPEWDRMKSLHKLVLIFVNGILLTPACAIITFTDLLLYDQYQTMSTIAPIMTPIHDQQLGGVIMKIMQEIVYIGAIAIVFFRWVRTERAKDDAELQAYKEGNPTPS